LKEKVLLNDLYSKFVLKEKTTQEEAERREAEQSSSQI
jgi:hypothetical protein